MYIVELSEPQKPPKLVGLNPLVSQLIPFIDLKLAVLIDSTIFPPIYRFFQLDYYACISIKI